MAIRVKYPVVERSEIVYTQRHKTKRRGVRNYSSNIIPTRELWTIVRKEVDAGQYELAKAHLALISSKWSEIGVRPKSYSAWDLLKEIEVPPPNIENGTGGKPSEAADKAPAKDQ